MKQREIAEIFDRMADLLELSDENPFRIRAYRRAAQTLEGFGGNLEELEAGGRLKDLPGIGQDLAAKITEYLRKGKIAAYEQLKRSVSPGIPELLAVPGLGPKTAKLLSEKLHITSVEELEKAARTHRLRTLPGFQAKKEENILKGISILSKGRERMDLGQAFALADAVRRLLQQAPGVTRISIAGSLRRMRETIGDIDLLISSKKPQAAMQAFTASPFCARVLVSGSTKSSILTPEGIQLDLRVVDPESFGAALQYFTGSKEHNVRLRELALRKGLKVNEYGVFRATGGKRLAGREEEDIYKALGLAWIPPELREDRGEIDAARSGALPALVDVRDLRGDFHIHSQWSDGTDTLEAIAGAGAQRGYEYLAMCDHSRSLRIANGMSIERLKDQMARICALNSRHRRKGCHLLMGSEVDILADGSLDYPDAVLAQLDFVVASIHSGFSQSEATLTKRMIRAIENPYVTLVAHPTGRLMGQRDPYAIDLEAVFRAAQATGTAMEINAYPKRLDLTDAAARRAKELGVTLAISTDTHRLDHLDHIVIGLGVARRAWCEPKHLLNCRPLTALKAWIAKKRVGATP